VDNSIFGAATFINYIRLWRKNFLRFLAILAPQGHFFLKIPSIQTQPVFHIYQVYKFQIKTILPIKK